MLCPAGIAALCYLLFILLHSAFAFCFTRLLQADFLGDQDILWRILADPLIIFCNLKPTPRKADLILLCSIFSTLESRSSTPRTYTHLFLFCLGFLFILFNNIPTPLVSFYTYLFLFLLLPL